MESEIIEKRFEAMHFLISNYEKWPRKIDSKMQISPPKFKNFRFVALDDGEIIFGDCIVRGISESEFLEYHDKCKETMDLF